MNLSGPKPVRLFFAAMMIWLGCSHGLPAVEPDEVLADPALESRARAISTELRCVVCQNQSLDDSDAPLARDLRVLVRERLKAGDTDAEVFDHLVKRYGEFVRLRPVVGAHTALLWLFPAIAFAVGVMVVLALFRRTGRRRS